MRLLFVSLLFLVVIVFSAVFAAVNSQTVEVNYLLAKANLPVAWLVAILITVGFILGWLWSSIWSIKKRRARRNEIL